MSVSEILHATLIAGRHDGAWRGVLLRGPSGSGKSSLALRAIAEGFRLVADDRVIVWLSGGQIFGRAPQTLSGLIEVRGVGVVPTPAPLRLCRIALVADLAAHQEEVERVPDKAAVSLAGVNLPRIRLLPFETAAPQGLVRALAAVQRPL